MKDTNRDFTTEIQLIKKYGISQKSICELLELSPATVYDKLNGLRGGRFTDAQKDKITHYLLSMGKVLVRELEK